jgi:hypothetical protein
MLFILFSCQQVLPAGSFFLESNNSVGSLIVDSKWYGQSLCVELYSSRWGTDGCVEAKIVEKITGGAWLSFTLQTGFGTGAGVVRWQGNEVMLPLGARQGEFDVTYTANQGEMHDGMREKWVEISSSGVEEEKRIWDIGEFVLVRNNTVKGAIEFQSDQDPTIFLFDDHWLTPEVITSEQFVDGPDILLTFPIEPSFNDEVGELRINTMTRTAVIPSDIMPQQIDIKYDLRPGIPPIEELQVLSNEVIQHSNEQEKDWIIREANNLLRSLDTEKKCSEWKLANQWKGIWAGYDLQTEWSDEKCILRVSTEFEQHRRRFQGKVSPDVLGESR